MPTFGIIAEGLTDQIVIEGILLGYFKNEEEPVINFVQPVRPTRDSPAPPAGWTLVFESLRRGEPQKALQFNNYLVIHIDTDVQEEKGFDVPRREGSAELSVPERVDRVIARLKREIPDEFYKTEGHRILFAVAVDSIECWLLPLLYNDNKAGKITGCLEAANAELRRKDKKDGLSAGDTKFPRAYERASRDYRKHKDLMKRRARNPSLDLFIKLLDELQSGSPASAPPDSQGPGCASPDEHDLARWADDGGTAR